jgi:hypothetical protein
MKRWVLLSALGLAVYLVFAIISFPARVALAWFAPDQVVLAGVQGTVWHGRAALGTIAGLPVSELTWDLKPGGLVLGRLGADMTTRLADGFVEASAVASGDRVVLTDLRGTTRLSSLTALVPLGSVDGLVTWQMERLELVDEWPVRAIGRLRVATLSAVALGLDNLGDYQLDFADQAAGDGISGVLKDTGGPLAVSGSLSLMPNREYSINGRVTARPGASPALTNGLGLLGGPAPDGSREFGFSGTL